MTHTAHLSSRNGIHNVPGFHECAITARNTWTRHPQLPPVNACSDVPAVAFS